MEDYLDAFDVSQSFFAELPEKLTDAPFDANQFNWTANKEHFEQLKEEQEHPEQIISRWKNSCVIPDIEYKEQQEQQEQPTQVKEQPTQVKEQPTQVKEQPTQAKVIEQINPPLNELHELFYGHQDATIKNLQQKPCKHDGIVKRTVTVCIDNKKKGKNEYEIDQTGLQYINGFGNEAYTNLVITSGNVEHIKLVCGGQLFDTQYLNKPKIPTKITNTDFYLMSDGRALPALEYHRILFVFESVSKEPITFTFDVVTPIVSEDDTKQEELFYSDQYDKTITKLNHKTELCFNHPVVQLIVRVQPAIILTDITRVYLMLCGVSILELSLVDDHYELFFGENTLNFSRIDKVHLVIETIPTPKSKCQSIEVETFAVTQQVVRRMSGMSGLAF